MTAWIIATASAIAAAQPVPSDPAPEQVSAEHAPARLDALLAAKDYEALGTTIRNISRHADLMSDLDWLRDRSVEGNSVFITMLYSRLLWEASALFPEPARSELRQTSAMTTLYALAAVRIDGARCGDQSAPSRRLEQLMTWNGEIWPFIRSLSPEQRARLVEFAILGERGSAARRDAVGDVEFLCRYGMEETAYNMEHGTSREVPSAPGVIGRTIELAGDGNYRPSERPEAEWRARASEVRSGLAAELNGLLETLDQTAPASASPGRENPVGQTDRQDDRD